jgi:hypothetical protein
LAGLESTTESVLARNKSLSVSFLHARDALAEIEDVDRVKLYADGPSSLIQHCTNNTSNTESVKE